MRKAKSNPIKIFIILSLILIISGCSASPVTGIFYTDVTYPSGDKVATEAVRSDKVGVASCQSVLFLVAWGECSIDAAMKEGDISKVHHVDQTSMNAYFFFSRHTVKVYGE